MGYVYLFCRENALFTIRSHKIFSDVQINEIIGSNPSEHFCVGKEYLLIANALSIMQKQMLKKKDVHKNAHSSEKGLTSERMFDIIYRTNVCSKSGKCFQTLRHSEQQHSKKFFHAAFELCSASGMIPDTFFISDYGFASAAFQNHTMMIEAESDYLMQHDLRSGSQMEEVCGQVDEC